MKYSFNDFIGPETLHTEYKEFSLHKTGIPFDREQVEEYCETNAFEFDDLVKANIMKYIELYVPKYISGFMNSNIPGEIYIGTDDYGMIKGIPLTIGNHISKKWLHDIITQTIETCIKTQDGHPVDIHVDILPVDKPVPLTGIHPSYQYYLVKKKKFQEQYHSFLQEYDTWRHTYELVNMKLVDLVNQPEYRQILIDYIKISPHRNETAIQTLLDDTFVLPSLSGEDIKDLKLDPSNVFYWVTTFKDELCFRYKTDKPRFLHRFKQRHIPFNLLGNLSDMIPYWKNIHLSLIRITCSVPVNPSRVLYFNGLQWIYCNRMIHPVTNQPMCLPS